MKIEAEKWKNWQIVLDEDPELGCLVDFYFYMMVAASVLGLISLLIFWLFPQSGIGPPIGLLAFVGDPEMVALLISFGGLRYGKRWGLYMLFVSIGINLLVPDPFPFWSDLLGSLILLLITKFLFNIRIVSNGA